MVFSGDAYPFCIPFELLYSFSSLSNPVESMNHSTSVSTVALCMVQAFVDLVVLSVLSLWGNEVNG